MSVFTSFWGFSETGGVTAEGESLNKSSIPVADCGLLSTALVESVFSAVDVSPAAANFDKGQSQQQSLTSTIITLKPKEGQAAC